MEETRICKRCHHSKPIEEFRKKIHTSTPFGKFCSDCKAYMNRRYRKDYAKGYFRHYRAQREYREKLLEEQLPDGLKRCRTCLKAKPIESFAVPERSDVRRPNGESKHCQSCREYKQRYMRDARKRWSAEYKAKVSNSAKRRRDDRRKEVIDHYGGKCECCGESHCELLTMDHKEKIGSKRRKENGEWGNRFYLSIVRRGFPDHLRVLCWNCNWSYGCYGYCPHQQERNAS